MRSGYGQHFFLPEHFLLDVLLDFEMEELPFGIVLEVVRTRTFLEDFQRGIALGDFQPGIVLEVVRTDTLLEAGIWGTGFLLGGRTIVAEDSGCPILFLHFSKDVGGPLLEQMEHELEDEALALFLDLLWKGSGHSWLR